MRDPEGIAAAIRAADSVCICSHVSPDGDTVGAALAMRLALKAMGKRVDIFCQDKIPDDLSFLPGVEEFRRPEECAESYDLFLPLDVSDEGRLGSGKTLASRCARSAQIDHHGTNPGYTEINSIDGRASATCTMIREQMRYLDAPLTREIAICLYTGISTDTGNFSFECTDAEAFRVMEDLLGAGVPLADLCMRLFREKSKPQLKLLGRAIEKLRFEADGQIAVMTLTRQDFADCGALSEHADTIVNYGLETVGTKMALLARESGDGRIKLSLRARAPLAIDKAAKKLGGGGHPQASGISMDGSLEDAVEKTLREMVLCLEKEEA